MVQTVTITGGLHCHHIHEDIVWGLVTVVMGSFNPFGEFKPNTIFERKRPKHELCLGFHQNLQASPPFTAKFNSSTFNLLPHTDEAHAKKVFFSFILVY